MTDPLAPQFAKVREALLDAAVRQGAPAKPAVDERDALAALSVIERHLGGGAG